MVTCLKSALFAIRQRNSNKYHMIILVDIGVVSSPSLAVNLEETSLFEAREKTSTSKKHLVSSKTPLFGRSTSQENVKSVMLTTITGSQSSQEKTVRVLVSSSRVRSSSTPSLIPSLFPSPSQSWKSSVTLGKWSSYSGEVSRSLFGSPYTTPPVAEQRTISKQEEPFSTSVTRIARKKVSLTSTSSTLDLGKSSVLPSEQTSPRSVESQSTKSSLTAYSVSKGSLSGVAFGKQSTEDTLRVTTVDSVMTSFITSSVANPGTSKTELVHQRSSSQSSRGM